MVKLSKEKLIEMLRVMYVIRQFELRMLEIFKEKTRLKDFPGALHSYEGQEAIATGVCACLRKDDYVLSTHRGHGHALAKGANLKKVVSELLGKKDGLSGGRGGSMHLFDPEIGLMGGNGIVGGGLPLALGTGYAAVNRGSDQVTACFFGEGAASQGSFHESINMAAVMKLPIIYVCENNLYAATTHVQTNCPIENITDRAGGYGIPGNLVDGNDVLAVYKAANKAVAWARDRKGPTLIECKTYRHRAHCMVIPEHRPRDEIQAWKQRDPIENFKTYLREEQILDQEEIDTALRQVEEELDEAVRFGKESPKPDPRTVGQHVWAD